MDEIFRDREVTGGELLSSRFKNQMLWNAGHLDCGVK